MQTKIITNISQLLTLNPDFFREEEDSDRRKPDLGIINNAAVLIEDGKIKWVGREADVGWDYYQRRYL